MTYPAARVLPCTSGLRGRGEVASFPSFPACTPPEPGDCGTLLPGWQVLKKPLEPYSWSTAAATRPSALTLGSTSRLLATLPRTRNRSLFLSPERPDPHPHQGSTADLGGPTARPSTCCLSPPTRQALPASPPGPPCQSATLPVGRLPYYHVFSHLRQSGHPGFVAQAARPLPTGG